MDEFFHTDALYVPDMVRDILNSPTDFFNWNYSKAPSFPDIFIFLLINLFFDSYNSIAVFFTIQIIFTVIVVNTIYKTKYPCDHYLLSSISIIGLSYLIIQQIYPYAVILNIAHHYSEYLIWLISCICFLRYLKSPNNSKLIFLLVIC